MMAQFSSSGLQTVVYCFERKKRCDNVKNYGAMKATDNRYVNTATETVIRGTCKNEIKGASKRTPAPLKGKIYNVRGQ